jgi:hypothetical protein
MRGFIRECHFASAERQFPGIRRFYEELVDKPATFLELVWRYVEAADRRSAVASSSPAVSSRPRPA